MGLKMYGQLNLAISMEKPTFSGILAILVLSSAFGVLCQIRGIEYICRHTRTFLYPSLRRGTVDLPASIVFFLKYLL